MHSYTIQYLNYLDQTKVKSGVAKEIGFDFGVVQILNQDGSSFTIPISRLREIATAPA